MDFTVELINPTPVVSISYMDDQGNSVNLRLSPDDAQKLVDALTSTTTQAASIVSAVANNG